MGICVSCRRRERKAPEKRSVPGAGGPAKGTAAAELLPRRVNQLTVMANSMSNIKMTNPIKGIVSKRRKRYIKDGFNLDLACILLCAYSVVTVSRSALAARDRCCVSVSPLCGQTCAPGLEPSLYPVLSTVSFILVKFTSELVC